MPIVFYFVGPLLTNIKWLIADVNGIKLELKQEAKWIKVKAVDFTKAEKNFCHAFKTMVEY